MKKLLTLFALLILLSACAPAATPTSEATLPQPAAAATATSSPLPPTATALPSPTLSPTLPPTAQPTETFTPQPTPTNAAPTETIGEMLKSHIVFFLIIPEKGHTDACGDFQLEPIISKRMRTGDPVQDTQIALNMLFSVGTRFYGSYYNALWDTAFTINSFTYTPSSDPQAEKVLVDFGGFFPVMQISPCDKHGIKEQIWKTFHYYGFVSKVFTYNGKFFIDQLSRK